MTENYFINRIAYQDWRAKQREELTFSEEEERLRKEIYDKSFAQASKLYNELKDLIQILPTKRRLRLFKFLQGQSLESIGQSEIPQSRKQSIHESLNRIWGKLGVDSAKARRVWQWGQSELENPDES